MHRLPTVVVRGEVLSSWLTVSDYNRTELAQALHVSKGRISQLLTSQEQPSAHLIAKLLTLTDLPFDRLFQIIEARRARTTHAPKNGGAHPQRHRRHLAPVTGRHHHTTRGAR